MKGYERATLGTRLSLSRLPDGALTAPAFHPFGEETLPRTMLTGGLYYVVGQRQAACASPTNPRDLGKTGFSS